MTSSPSPVSQLQRVLADIGLGTTGTAVSKVAAFAGGVILARAMEPGQYGLYLTWTTAALLTTPVLDAGFTALVFRRASETGTTGWAWRAARQRFGYWFIALGGGTLAACAIGREQGLAVAATGVIAASQSHIDVIAAESEGSGRFGYAAQTRAMFGIAFLIAALIVAGIRPAALGALLALALSRVTVATAASIRHRGPLAARSLPWRDAVVLGSTGIVINAYAQSDVVFLAWLGVPQDEIAVYAVGYTLLFGLLVLPAAVGAALFPQVVRSGLSSPKFVQAVAFLGMALASAIAAAGFASEEIFGVFGEHYRANAGIGLPVLMLVMPTGVNMVLLSSLQGRHRERSVLAISIAAAIINAGLHIILIPKFGTQGALSATATCEVIVLALLTRLARSEGAARSLSLVISAPTLVVTISLLLPVSSQWRTASSAFSAFWFTAFLLTTRATRTTPPVSSDPSVQVP